MTTNIFTPATPPATLTITSINHEGRGVARREDGKTIFVDGALTGEVVNYSIYRKKDSFEMAQITKIVRPRLSTRTFNAENIAKAGSVDATISCCTTDIVLSR